MANETRPRSTPSLSNRKSNRYRSVWRVALVALATATISLAAIAESLAQMRGGPANRGPAGIGMRPTGPTGPTLGGLGSRTPGNDGPRRPGMGPNFPGRVIVIPPGMGPRGPGGPAVIVDDIDDTPRRRAKGTKQTKQTQTAQRSGFNPPPPGEQRFVPNEVVLNVASTVPTPTLDAMARRHRLTRLESQEFTLTRRKLFRWRINDGRPVAAVIRSLQADARILGAQPNYLYALQQDPPGPPMDAKLDQSAPQPDSAQYALTKMRLPQAHAIAKGERVLVAVIDSPIDAAHPDLAGVIAATFDATGAADKPHPHGTAMAGAIAARGKITGTAPGVKILSVQAFGSARSDGTSFHILKGLEWAAKANANVINMSFAGPADPQMQAMLAAARAKGIVLIAAAGNAGPRSRPLYPAADPNVIAVTATDFDDKPFAHANRGSYIAVAAPGVDVLVAAPGGAYGTTSGTSVAAAEVSGIAALMIERNPKLDPASIRRFLMSTARDLGPAGPDDQFGAGLTDALGAVTSPGVKPADVSRSTGATQ